MGSSTLVLGNLLWHNEFRVRFPTTHNALTRAEVPKDIGAQEDRIHIMSMETREHLNEFILVGNCKMRPRAWHDDPELRERLGLPENHFDDPIPYQIVKDRLFNWQAIATPTANLIPCQQVTDEDGILVWDHEPEMWLDVENSSVPHWISMSTRQGIVRSDNHLELGNHSSSYRIHDYEQWLLQLQSNVIGDSLSIIGAGLLRNGAQAFVQVALPDTAHDETTGMKFIPFIMAATSLDGSIPSTFSAQTIYVVCDNTRDMALRQAEQSGRIYKAKHTSKSLDSNKIGDVRSALGIIHQTADAMMNELHELASISISRKETLKVLDIIIPIPNEEDQDFSIRKQTIAINKREKLAHSVFRDPMGGGDWVGTALGVVNGVNTYFTHYESVRGATRVERNYEKTIKGEFADIDRGTVKAIAQVLDKPELVSAN